MKRIHPYTVVVLATLVSAFGAQAQDTAALVGIDPGPNGVGVAGQASSTVGETVGVVGTSASNEGVGVNGTNTATSGFTIGVEAVVSSAGGIASAGSAQFTQDLV